MKAMELRKEELLQYWNEKNQKKDDDFFVTSKAIMRIKLKSQADNSKNKPGDLNEFDQFTLFKRKNNYNEEDDVDIQDVPEENIIVATWINDLGNNHKEFDVGISLLDKLTFIQDKILFFNNETLLMNKV